MPNDASETVDLDDAFDAGRAAKRAGKAQDSNPHPPGSRLYNPWRGGWQAEGHHHG